MILEEHHSPVELCNQFDVNQPVELLGVSERPAKRYQTGESQPRRGCLEYLRSVHFDRLMQESWPHYMRFLGDQVTTGGAVANPLRWQHLEQFSWILGQWYQMLDDVLRLEHEVRVLSRQVSENEAEAARAALSTVVEGIGDQDNHWLRIKALRRLTH